MFYKFQVFFFLMLATTISLSSVSSAYASPVDVSSKVFAGQDVEEDDEDSEEEEEAEE